MTAYVPVPKDLTKVKSKFLFNLTKRQVICFSLGALVGIPVFFLTKKTLGASMATLLMIALMLPFFMLAMFERHGQPLEVVVKHFVQARFLRSRVRPYQTDNFYTTINRNVRNRQEVQRILYGRKQEKDAKAESDAG